MPTIDLNGFTMSYEEGGQGEPLVYVHGGNTCLLHAFFAHHPFQWRWRQDFTERFHFIWYERRGCFHSFLPDGEYDLETQATDLSLLLDHLQIERAHVVGMSAGGPISVVFSARWPHRVSSLALVSSGINLWSLDDPKMAIVRAQLAILQREGAEAAFDQRPAEAEVSLDPLWEREEAALLGALDVWQERQRKLAQQAATIPRAERVRRYAAELMDMTAGMDCDLPSYATRITARTLVIHGSADPIVPQNQGQALAAMIPHAEWRIVEGEGHRMLMTNAAVRRAVMAFAEEGPRVIESSPHQGSG